MYRDVASRAEDQPHKLSLPNFIEFESVDRYHIYERRLQCSADCQLTELVGWLLHHSLDTMSMVQSVESLPTRVRAHVLSEQYRQGLISFNECQLSSTSSYSTQLKEQHCLLLALGEHSSEIAHFASSSLSCCAKATQYNPS